MNENQRQTEAAAWLRLPIILSCQQLKAKDKNRYITAGRTSESVSSLITMTQTALKIFVSSPFAHLKLLLTREYLIEFSRREICKLNFPQGHCGTQSLTHQSMFSTTQKYWKTRDLGLSLRSPILYRVELRRFKHFGEKELRRLAGSYRRLETLHCHVVCEGQTVP